MASDAVEVVFSLSGNSGLGTNQKQASSLYHYTQGPVKVPGPWKRGRPSKKTKAQYKNDSAVGRAASTFEFIHIAEPSNPIDGVSRRTIRRHAKLSQVNHKGHRNAGHVRLQHESADQSTDRDKPPQQQGMAVRSINLIQGFAGVDPFETSSVKLEPYMLDLLYYFSTHLWKTIYSLEDMAGCNPIVEYWLPLAFKDPALLHSLLGCADTYIFGYRTIHDGGARGFKHLHTAVSIINQRLSVSQPAYSIATLAVVAAIALLEKGAGRHEHWRIHMRGLKQLVDQRGGLESLLSEPMVLHKIYRADLYGAIDAAQSPFFKGPIIADVQVEGTLRSPGFRSLTSLCSTIHSSILHLENAHRFWFHIDMNAGQGAVVAGRSPAGAAQIRHLLTNVQYALIAADFQHEPAHHGHRDRETCEVIRLALILYTLTILNERPPSTAVGEQLCAKFRGLLILTDAVPEQQQQQQQKPGCVEDLTSCSSGDSCLGQSRLPVDFLLWAVFLAAGVLQSRFCGTRTWIMGSLMRLSASNKPEVHGWQDLKARLSCYLWVLNIHDPIAQTVWGEIKEEQARLKSGFSPSQ
ncbi:hypothetical protein BX600DRAFT_475314 [Xylariales sp. PMI_506]|nr:hypothetical protein BX600DRAFT_475314 [Xylariales sp. PMI_506]